VADVGCGHGASTILMARAFPNSTFIGSDYHEGSIQTARQRGTEAGVGDRAHFEVAPAASFSGRDYDLVTMFDCLHDMGDPVGAARHVYESLAPDGTWMIVEPAAGDRVEDNLNPVGRAYYSFSTLLCTPASLSQDVGLALGAQAGEARIRDVVTSAGLTRFRRVSETPFNLIFEARP
jgi:ubiquinone/menaquinone biosynthesis C-methylase UbiE